MSLSADPTGDKEIAAFKADLDNAGQPWSRIGVRIIGVGFVGCLLNMIASEYVVFIFNIRFPIFIVCLTVIAAGWVFLITAMLKRRQWAQAQALNMPPLSGPGAPGAQ
jgi:hypothetical protein